jgi:transposase
MTTIAPTPQSVDAPRRGPVIERLPDRKVTGGVDTHADTHTAAVVDTAGRLLGSAQFPTTPAGYRTLLGWLRSFGVLVLVGIEGTGVYGAGLARHLASENVAMAEVDRPDRRTRRFAGKSDPIDAEAAARAALSGRQNGIPKTREGAVEALRVLRIARRAAVAHRADLQRRLRAVIITAPEDLRGALRALPLRELLATCATLRPDRARLTDPTQATKRTLRLLARRHHALSEEISDLDTDLDTLVAEIHPALLAVHGVGTDIAGQLLVTAGANHDRLHSEAAFAALCGVSPVPASSGRTHRHRLNRGGDRGANCALWRIVITRLRHDARTRAYMTRRTTEGLSKTEIIRCLKRYIAREIYYVLTQPRPLDSP